MKYFGIVKSFDETNGQGLIAPDTGGDLLSFDQGPSSWNRVAPPRPGQRLSYDLHHTNGQASARNVEPI